MTAASDALQSISKHWYATFANSTHTWLRTPNLQGVTKLIGMDKELEQEGSLLRILDIWDYLWEPAFLGILDIWDYLGLPLGTGISGDTV